MKNLIAAICFFVSGSVFADAILDADITSCKNNKTYVVFEASCFSDKCGKGKSKSGDNWLYMLSHPAVYDLEAALKERFAAKTKRKVKEAFYPHRELCFNTWKQANTYMEKRIAELELSDEKVVSIYW